MKKQEIQEKYLQLQMFDTQIKEMQQQLETFQNQKAEINNIMLSLDEFKETEKGADILAPISAGIFIKAKVNETKEVLMNVGSDVVVNKSVDDAKKLLSEQIGKLMRLQEELTKQINDLASRAIPLQEELNKMIENVKEEDLN